LLQGLLVFVLGNVICPPLGADTVDSKPDSQWTAASAAKYNRPKATSEVRWRARGSVRQPIQPAPDVQPGPPAPDVQSEPTSDGATRINSTTDQVDSFDTSSNNARSPVSQVEGEMPLLAVPGNSVPGNTAPTNAAPENAAKADAIPDLDRNALTLPEDAPSEPRLFSRGDEPLAPTPDPTCSAPETVVTRRVRAVPELAQNLGGGLRSSPTFDDAFNRGPQTLEVDCDVERQKLKPIKAITNKLAAEPGDFPPECNLGELTYVPRCLPPTTYTWRASNLCHKPLYFEDVAVERYGISLPPGLQSISSGVHFFTSLCLVPYKMGIELPNECVYDLGYYRPGSCAPQMIFPFPISLRGAVLEATVIGAGVAILP
jgi:hypothetical protein